MEPSLECATWTKSAKILLYTESIWNETSNCINIITFCKYIQQEALSCRQRKNDDTITTHDLQFTVAENENEEKKTTPENRKICVHMDKDMEYGIYKRKKFINHIVDMRRNCVRDQIYLLYYINSIIHTNTFNIVLLLFLYTAVRVSNNIKWVRAFSWISIDYKYNK